MPPNLTAPIEACYWSKTNTSDAQIGQINIGEPIGQRFIEMCNVCVSVVICILCLKSWKQRWSGTVQTEPDPCCFQSQITRQRLISCSFSHAANVSVWIMFYKRHISFPFLTVGFIPCFIVWIRTGLPSNGQIRQGNYFISPFSPAPIDRIH